MQFRLIYQGPLASQQSSGGCLEQKHAIRRVFHDQLRTLWNEHASFRYMRPRTWDAESQDFVLRLPGPSVVYRHRLGHDVGFVPLIGKHRGLSCSLDVVFLRRDSPGGFIQHGGDVDNRLKVLFDALRMPSQDELLDEPPPIDENPMFVVMEDDKFIDAVNVTTDRLLVPQGPGEHKHNVILIIRIETIVFDISRAPLASIEVR
jgi:hypothetical protein